MKRGYDSTLGFEIIEIARKIQLKINNRLMPFGMTFPQYRVISMISLEGDMIQKLIGEELTLSKSTLTPMIQLMERKEWIIRTTDESDTRSKRIQLTEPGIKVLKMANEVVNEYVQFELNVLTDDEQSMMIKILRNLKSHLNFN